MRIKERPRSHNPILKKAKEMKYNNRNLIASQETGVGP
jgi:hypothetical protein